MTNSLKEAMSYYEYEGELADFIDELTKED